MISQYVVLYIRRTSVWAGRYGVTVHFHLYPIKELYTVFSLLITARPRVSSFTGGTPQFLWRSSRSPLQNKNPIAYILHVTHVQYVHILCVHFQWQIDDQMVGATEKSKTKPTKSISSPPHNKKGWACCNVIELNNIGRELETLTWFLFYI